MTRAAGMPARPPWLRSKALETPRYREVVDILSRHDVRTVCSRSGCPNLFACFGRGIATFLVLGDTCTRSCRFCGIASGHPRPPEPLEPLKVASAVADLRLDRVVITSVTRDDLLDGGAAHFARTVRSIRKTSPACRVETLVPDFHGRLGDLDSVLSAGPDVVSHNIETVPRLYNTARQGASYTASLQLLAHVAERASHAKSGLMVGLGETREEVVAVMRDLRHSGCESLTIGQYLSPSPRHLPVSEYLRPEAFAQLSTTATAMGFRDVICEPLARTSYQPSNKST